MSHNCVFACLILNISLGACRCCRRYFRRIGSSTVWRATVPACAINAALWRGRQRAALWTGSGEIVRARLNCRSKLMRGDSSRLTRRLRMTVSRHGASMPRAGLAHLDGSALRITRRNVALVHFGAGRVDAPAPPTDAIPLSTRTQLHQELDATSQWIIRGCSFTWRANAAIRPPALPRAVSKSTRMRLRRLSAPS